MNFSESVAELERRIKAINAKFRDSGSQYCVEFSYRGGWRTLEFRVDYDNYYFLHDRKSTRNIDEFLEHLDSIVLHNTLDMLAKGKLFMNKDDIVKMVK